jgi:membrane protein implicated in regulation of membrane protease activity
MSLRIFHLFFIAMSVVLAAFVAAWAGGQYRELHDGAYAVAGIASLAAAVALAVYGAAFQRKTRNLH